MKKSLTASVTTILAMAFAVPVFAGANCGSHATAATANAQEACVGKTSKSAAWAGACLQRSASGQVTVTDVAKGSPAARSGLKSGDIVLAVNGYDLSDAEDRAMCASKASCKVGSQLTYTVQRGSSTKDIKLKLEKMPANATAKFGRLATFDPTLAAVVMPAVNN